MRKFVKSAVATLALLSLGGVAHAQLAPNQTAGYGDGDLLTFTYTQNFVCVEQPNNDLNFNGRPAQSDPAETKIPICQVNFNPTINPPGMTGNPRSTTDPIFVLVPMFSADNDQNPNDAIPCSDALVAGTACGPALGSTLIKLFGALPEGFKAKPAVYTQCPAPNEPAGSCTMHATRLDLAPLLAKLGYLKPPLSNVFVPSPNHSHVLPSDTITLAPEWWQVIPVLVLQQSDWPSQDGKSGIVTVDEIVAAAAAKRVAFAPSNFFLYFGSQVMGSNMAKMHH